MFSFYRLYPFSIVLLMLYVGACKPKENTVTHVEEPIKMEETNESVQQAISSILESGNDADKNGKFSFIASPVLKTIYTETNFAPIWCGKDKFREGTHLFRKYLDTLAYQGIWPDDYNVPYLQSLMLGLDTNATLQKDAKNWAKVDIMLSSALIGIMQDLKQGRLTIDKQKWMNNPEKNIDFFQHGFKQILEQKDISFLNDLHPKIAFYHNLKKGIPLFVDSMDKTRYTYLPYPAKDSLAFIKLAKKRFNESGIGNDVKGMPDSTDWVKMISAYQKKKKLKVDGKMSAGLVRILNNSDLEKYRRISVTLDRYKLLPEKMPSQYIWVNLPGYYLDVWHNDTLIMDSKVIVGAPGTPTPEITSEISDMVLNPTWTVPSSIIEKEMLPGLKRNPNYLARRGLYLLNSKGERIDPSSINWNKYKKGIPYRIQQGSGDNNALGLMKFNFKNKHSVYLHDTNVRRLFGNKNRSLSHGCVRVKEWQKLADFIAINDSINLPVKDTLRYTKDSIYAWLDSGRYRIVPVVNKIPIFIRYFTAYTDNEGKIRFYDDIYGEDRRLRERFYP